MYKEMGIVQSFETILENVFTPLFEVTVDPASHPQLHVFLKLVSNNVLFLRNVFSIYLGFGFIRRLSHTQICFEEPTCLSIFSDLRQLLSSIGGGL